MRYNITGNPPGRPKKPENEKVKRRYIWLNNFDWKKFVRLGKEKWLREKLEEEK